MTLLKMKLLVATFLSAQFANATPATLPSTPINDTTGINRNMPGQVSLVPGLSTNGQYAPQSTSHFSFNLLGGENGGVDGFEFGGLFNMVHKNVEAVQIAGIFNRVGGQVSGFQMGGIYNKVHQSVTGSQVAGIANMVDGKLTGFQMGGILNDVKQDINGIQIAGIASLGGSKLTGLQISGIYNQLKDSLSGIQIAGIANIAQANITEGLQIGGIANIARKEVNGVQIAGIVNYARKLKGVQIGLINIADSTAGYSIGLLNISPQSFYRVTVFTNEMMNTNVAFKSGTPKLYGIILGGANLSEDKKMYSVGVGIGHEIALGSMFTVNPEITSQYLNRGGPWKFDNSLNRLQANVHVKLGKYVTVFAGPTFSVFNCDEDDVVVKTGYKSKVTTGNYHSFKLWEDTTAWFGWNAGITIF
jgi:hypothetical protein